MVYWDMVGYGWWISSRKIGVDQNPRSKQIIEYRDDRENSNDSVGRIDSVDVGTRPKALGSKIMIIMSRYCVNKWNPMYRVSHTIRYNKFKRVKKWTILFY